MPTLKLSTWTRALMVCWVIVIVGTFISRPASASVVAQSQATKTALPAPRIASGPQPDVAGEPDPFGSAKSFGSAPANLVKPVISMTSTIDGQGYWMVAPDGGVFSFGDAGFHGSMGGKPLNQPVVGMAADPAASSASAEGYWLVASDGGIFAFGDAGFHGSMGAEHLNAPVVGMAAAPDGNGYWLVASDGGIFSFGSALFHGSMGGKHLNAPIVGMAAAPGGGGYWLVASDGGVFAFGDAKFYGSMGDKPLNAPVVGMAAPSDGSGYWLVASDGGVFSFDEPFEGSLGATALADPVTAMAAVPGGAGYWLLPTTAPPTPVVRTPPPPCGSGYVCGQVTAIGDSVMLDVQPALQADISGIDVNAAVSRQWDQGIELAEQLVAAATMGSTVVVDLGTNGPVTLQMFQQMMSVLSGAALVVFVTVHLPPSYSWWQSVNQVLEQGVTMYPNTRLADFNALADQNPQWFGSDGVHMPIGGAGAQAMAALIKQTIDG